MKHLFIILASLFSMSVAQGATLSSAEDADQYTIVMEPRSSRMDFDEVEVSGGVRLIVEERTEGNIIIRAQKHLLEYVTLYVSDNTLHAGLRLPKGGHRHSYRLIKLGAPSRLVEIYVPNNGRINEITASGASSVKIVPTLSAAELDIEASGASTISLSTNSPKVSIDLSGASTLKIDAQINSMDADVAGASTLKCYGSLSGRFEAEVSGASTLTADEFAAHTLELEVTGASSAKAKCDIGIVEVSGASGATIECSTSLNASASSASTVRYKGDCNVNLRSVTGASSIKKL